jgi:signal transduction histidine kinase
MAAPEQALTERRTGWPGLDDILQGSHELPRWIGWRLRALVVLMLLGCALVFLVAHWVSSQPRLPFGLRATAEGLVKIHAVDYPPLQHLEGQVLLALRPGGPRALPSSTGSASSAAAASRDAAGTSAPIELLMLQRSPRWIIDPEQRQHHLALHEGVHALLKDWSTAGASVQLTLGQASTESVLMAPIGWTGLSPLFWLLAVLSVLVFGVGAVVLLAGPQWRNAAFALLAMCQSGQLMFMAIETNLDVFAPPWFVLLDGQLRLAFDLISAACLVQIAVLHPAKMPGALWYSALAWLAAAGLWVGMGDMFSTLSWWWLQLGCIGLSVAALSLMSAALLRTPHPFTLVMRRFVVVATLTWALLSLAIWRGTPRPDMQLHAATFGVMAWQVFIAMAVLLSPYLSRSRPILQEFSLLAASSTIAASLDLLFVAVFSLGQFTSMTIALFFSFGLYLIIRRWLMTRLPGRDSLTMERLFQRLYRIAREVERSPDSLDASLMRLMRELYDPLEVSLVPGEISHTALRGNGSVLLVPIPLNAPHAASAGASTVRHVLVLKHSHKGQRLFTSEDARLAERVMEQLHRALSFDQAVEQGRSEERLRIAQDLHDDIGARLLTLMYQAPNAEIEEYIRHTIQDLKTLTRGLAAQSHGLAEAAGEWKRDLSQRLTAARCELDWQMSLDAEVTLSMVQWSALTRILRELVSNAISHAKANKVHVQLRLQDDRLSLSVEDNGVGREPASWSHGLGLGGVRKRVKQLSGSVRWLEVEPKGIRCEVVVENFSGLANLTGTAATSTHQGTLQGGAHHGATNPGLADGQLSH